MTRPTGIGRAGRLGLLAGLLMLLAPAGARADQADPRLDALFAALAAASDPAEALNTEGAIRGLWFQSGSDAVDYLAQQGARAAEAGDAGAALRFFDAVTTLAPRFAEGWHRRGALRRAAGDGAGALADLERALALEPRHFGALAEKGRILEAEGDAAGARDAYGRALALHPHLPGLADRLAALGPPPGGRGI